MIVVDQPDALMDVPVAIELREFTPRQAVTVTATQSFPSNSRWQAHATFMTDESGAVGIARQAPISGSYEGVAAMGLIWSAERVSPPSPPFPDDWVLQPSFIHFEAVGPNHQRAELAITRRSAGPGVTRRVIRIDGLVGILFLPPGEGPHPSVLILHGGGGGMDEYSGAMLASRGYAAFNLAYFSEPGLPRGLVNIPLEYFEHAIRWMRAQPWLRDGFLAVWGPSRGGELALLLGATFPDINAVSAWVPSGVMFWPIGLAEQGDTRPPASWTWRGKPLPYLQENNGSVEPLPPQQPGQPTAYTPVYLRHLRDERAVERATIPVEKIRGPVLLVSGTDDQMWPSSVLADIAMRRLESNGFKFPFRHLKYEGAGHLILLPWGPRTTHIIGFKADWSSGLVYAQGGTPRTDAEAGADAWHQMLQFLEAGASAHINKISPQDLDS
ncbi:MAG TPA: acyl-CoA thioesterase/bile acid-CoA:amino acid N-acyltransferase family protein [Steroidobacteraceae bacterium]|jgi:dienelactone hydrolase|nr:acyl-CoA thioesterase/bile acid-CoA:amino acid N-acyltransferase family protein [Steroidobacteraceae bacterium]